MRLADHHRLIRAGIDEIRQQCDRLTPDLYALSAARLRLSKSSADRSRYIRDVLTPRLRERALRGQLEELAAMLSSFALKRQISSAHVTTWTSAAIAENWQGYRNAASAIWDMMEVQMQREVELFRGYDSYLDQRG